MGFCERERKTLYSHPWSFAKKLLKQVGRGKTERDPFFELSIVRRSCGREIRGSLRYEAKTSDPFPAERSLIRGKTSRGKKGERP